MRDELTEDGYPIRPEMKSPSAANLAEMQREFGMDKDFSDPDVAAEFVRTKVLPWWFESHKKEWGFLPDATVDDFEQQREAKRQEAEETAARSEEERQRHLQNQEIPKPPVIDDEPPVIDDEPPVIDDEPPVIDDEPPVIDDESPVIDDEPPVIDDEPPVAPSGSPPGNQYFPPGDNPYLHDDEPIDDDEEDYGPESKDEEDPDNVGEAGFAKWKNLAKNTIKGMPQKPNFVHNALDSYEETMKTSIKLNGPELSKDQVDDLAKLEMKDLAKQIKELFMNSSSEDSPYSIQDVLNMIEKLSEKKQLGDTIDAVDDDEYGDNTQDPREDDDGDYGEIDDEGEYNWGDHNIPIGKLKLEDLKKKLTE